MTLQTSPAHLGAAPAMSVGPLRTAANIVTATRTAAAVALGVVATASGSGLLLALAFATYWIGDMLDGWVARRLDQETRLGAIFDIVSDRACTAVLFLGLLPHLGFTGPSSEVVPVATAFLLSFMVLDTMVSLAFLCWPLRSPNDFHQVDATLWRLNWSPPAKAANTAGVVGALFLGHPWIALLVALVVVGVKLWSARRVLQLLEHPEDGDLRC